MNSKRRRRACQYQQQEQKRKNRHSMQTLTVIWLTLIGITTVLAAVPFNTTTTWATTTNTNNNCRATLAWPVTMPYVTRAFDGPEQPWLPGHRGVDLQTATNDTILAPDDGTISFAGKVAGKSVVSINHGNITSTLEPATTHLQTGAAVTRGQHIAQVTGESDHCGNTCLHWGVKQGTDQYLNPETLAAPRRITLKPIQENSP